MWLVALMECLLNRLMQLFIVSKKRRKVGGCTFIVLTVQTLKNQLRNSQKSKGRLKILFLSEFILSESLSSST